MGLRALSKVDSNIQVEIFRKASTLCIQFKFINSFVWLHQLKLYAPPTEVLCSAPAR